MDEILKKLEGIEDRIGGIEGRLSSLESRGSISPAILQTRELPSAPPLPPLYSYSQDNNPFVPPVLGNPTPKGESDSQELKPTGGFESYFGKWILGVVGIVSILFGVGYFLQYAFEKDWITPAGRVMIGLGGGVLFVVLGELVRKSQEKYSYMLSSAGLGLLYLSTYAAYGYYGLVSAGTSFLFMTAVTAFGVVLSLWTNSMILASLTTAMGFLVPYLFGLKAASDLGYFIYTLSLNIGILSVAFFKKWRQLTALGFIGTILHFTSWHSLYYTEEKLAIAIYALVVFYLIYLAVSIFNKFIAGEKSDRDDLIMLTLNPAWFFAQLYYLLQPGGDTKLALVAVGMSAVYIAIAYAFKVYRNDDQTFALFLGAIGAVFLTIAIPLQFEQNTIAIAWAVEAVLIAILGAVTRNDGMKKASLVIFAIALCRFFIFDNFGSSQDLSTWIPIFNKTFFTYLILIFSGTIIAYLFGQLMGEEYRSDVRVVAILWTVVNLLIFTSITGEIGRYFDKAHFNLSNQISEEMKRLPPPDPLSQNNPSYEYNYPQETLNTNAEYTAISNQKNASISVFWMFYAIVLVAIGIVLQYSFLRKSALILFGITIIKVFLFDLSGLETPYRIFSFMVLGVILLTVSYLYFRHQKNIEKDMSQVVN